MVKTTNVIAVDSPGKQSPRLIKLVAGLCIGQIVMGIVTTTIVGVIVDRHANDIDELKHNTGALQGDVKLLQANTVHGTALGSEDNANIKSKLSNLESNQTNSYSELIKVKNHVDEVNAKIDMIEANKNTNIAAIQENTDVLTIALTELKDHKSILQNISTILDVLTSNSSDMTNDRSTVIHMNTTFESNIEKNQVKIEENVLNIHMLSENVTAQHILLNDQSTRTRTLEVDVTLVKDAIQVLNDTIKHVKTNTCMCEQNESFHERLFGLDNITTQVQSVKDYVANYSDHINDLETSQVALNFEIQVLHNAVQKLELNANFTQQILEDTSANIQLLELQANSTQHAFIEHGTRMHAIELELGNLEDYNKRIEQVETETNFTKDTLEDIKTRIEDIEHVGNVTQSSVQDIIGRLANMTDKAMSAFSVGLRSELIVPKYDKVIYDHVIFDLNGDFNMSTGEFVAPIAGLYEFSFHATGYWHERLWLELYCNDRYIIAAFGEMPDDATYPVAGNAAVFELKNKDRCYIKTGEFDIMFWGATRSICTTFSGHLIAKDTR